MKTILITGATGFLGTHFSKHYIDQGYKVIGVASKSEKDVPFNGMLEYKQFLLPDNELYDLIKKHNMAAFNVQALSVKRTLCEKIMSLVTEIFGTFRMLLF